MNLSNQRRTAAKLMKAGVNRVQFNKDRISDAAEAITREDIRSLIRNGVITLKPEKSTSRSRAKSRLAEKRKGRHKGYGKRKARGKARLGGKEAWIKKVRALRDELSKLKQEKKLHEGEYRKLYRQIKGNLYHSRRHLLESLERARK
ncbi:MAG: 50S ribosomal protein L19e [Candidatus Altiarchaeota archaeon]|nr:50S ribosomal protein L19e [Candidatus Altiarchaeota archaeon]